MQKISKNLLILSLFSISMGFLETIVVIYLRQIYYPEGFNFPLKILPLYNLRFEYLRELTTIIMLLCIAIISGNNIYERFAYFLFCFGLWDIFYYIGLKILIKWPPSLLTWDVLFLIPFIWLAPVIAPLICAFIMVVLSIIILLSIKNIIKMKTIDLLLIFSGAFIIFISFIWDTISFILTSHKYNILNSEFISAYQFHLQNLIPNKFFWELYIIGVILIGLSILIILKRFSKHN